MIDLETHLQPSLTPGHVHLPSTNNPLLISYRLPGASGLGFEETWDSTTPNPIGLWFPGSVAQKADNSPHRPGDEGKTEEIA